MGTDILKYPYKIIKNELKFDCRFYDLRGSYATAIFKNGSQLREVADILGHSRIETTENYYIYSTPETRKNAIYKFEEEIAINTMYKIASIKN